YPQMPVLDQLVYFARLHGQDKLTARDQARLWVERLGLGLRQYERVVALSHGNRRPRAWWPGGRSRNGCAAGRPGSCPPPPPRSRALGVVLLSVTPALARGPTTSPPVGRVGQGAQALGPGLRATAAAAKVNITVSSVPDAASARSAVSDGSLDVALSAGSGSAVAEVKQSLAPAIQALLRETVDVAHQRQVLTQAGVPAAIIGPAMRPVPSATNAIQPPPAVSPARRVAALASAILMFVTLSIYGTAIANGVAQEKTTRTAEVLLAMVRPRQLLFGKVTGIGTCALVQVGIAVGAGLLAHAVARDTPASSPTLALPAPGPL